MSGWGSGRRRGLAVVAVAACALSLMFALPGMVSGAGANIANPGNIEVSMGVSVLTPTLTLSGMSTKAMATATVQSNGSMFVARAALAFDPVNVNIAPPNALIGAVTVQLVAGSDFIGAVNPSSGVEWLAGRLEMLWVQSGTMTGCPVGPFDVVLTTTSAGAQPYASATGTATMVDGNFALDAVAPGTFGCGGLENAVNSTLSLPITTTTTTSGSTTSTSTTTTTASTSTTAPGAPLPGTPVPAVVLSTRLTPAPRAPSTSTSHPTTTTTLRTTTTHAPTTLPPSHLPKKVHHPPKPAGPKKQHVVRQKRSPVKHHRKRRVKHRQKHRTRHHKKHLKKLQTKQKAGVPRVSLAPGRPRTPMPRPRANAARRAYGAAWRAAARAHRRPRRATPFHPTFASSRHRASPSGLNWLAMLALVVSAGFAVKLMTPEFSSLVRRRRRRLYGIDARVTDV